MIVYIGSAIDMSLGSPHDQFAELGQAVVEGYKDKSVIVYNPLTAFINAAKITEAHDRDFLINMNNAAIDGCDLAVFAWTNSPSYGVPLEIERCKSTLKPYVIWNRAGRSLGIYLQQTISNSAAKVVNSKEELQELLQSEWATAIVGQQAHKRMFMRAAEVSK